MKIKTFAIISLFLLLLFISACGEGKKEQLPVVGQQNNTTSESDVKVDIVEPPQKVDLSTVKKVKIKDAGINVEIADTPDERRIGLMNRDELPADSRSGRASGPAEDRHGLRGCSRQVCHPANLCAHGWRGIVGSRA